MTTADITNNFLPKSHAQFKRKATTVKPALGKDLIDAAKFC